MKALAIVILLALYAAFLGVGVGIGAAMVKAAYWALFVWQW